MAASRNSTDLLQGRLASEGIVMRNSLLFVVGSVLTVCWIAGSTSAKQSSTPVAVGPVGVAQTATPMVVTIAPTQIDPTVIALEKEKLEREVGVLRQVNDHPVRSWLLQNVAVLLAVVAGVWTVISWFREQSATRQRHDEERFERLTERLDGDRPATRLNAAIGLRTFLNRGYETYYGQVFSHAVAHIRLRPDPSPLQLGQSLAGPATPLNQALAVALRESYPLARDMELRRGRFRRLVTWVSKDKHRAGRTPTNTGSPFTIPDAGGIQLSNISWDGADLRGIWMPNWRR